MSSYHLDNPRLIAAFEQLQRQETAQGSWALGGTTLSFGDELQGRFPLVGRFVNEHGQPTTGQLSPDRVVRAFEGVVV